MSTFVTIYGQLQIEGSNESFMDYYLGVCKEYENTVQKYPEMNHVLGHERFFSLYPTANELYGKFFLPEEQHSNELILSTEAGSIVLNGMIPQMPCSSSGNIEFTRFERLPKLDHEVYSTDPQLCVYFSDNLRGKTYEDVPAIRRWWKIVTALMSVRNAHMTIEYTDKNGSTVRETLYAATISEWDEIADNIVKYAAVPKPHLAVFIERDMPKHQASGIIVDCDRRWNVEEFDDAKYFADVFGGDVRCSVDGGCVYISVKSKEEAESITPPVYLKPIPRNYLLGEEPNNEK